MEISSTTLKLQRLILSLVLLCVSFSAHSIQIIVNESVDLSTLSSSMIHSLFNMRLNKWPDGSPVKVFTYSDDNSTHQQFCKTILRTNVRKQRKRLNKLIFSGLGQEPEIARSRAVMEHLIATTPGAIGYIDDTPSPLAPAIRVVSIHE